MRKMPCKPIPQLLVFLALLLTSCLQGNAGIGTSSVNQNAAALDGTSAGNCASCEEFNRLNTLVRDGKIGRAAAREELYRLIPLLKEYYHQNGGKDYPQSDWVFPLKGYSSRAIDGGRRHGYEPRGYDFFAGNRHTAHPSLDIFIRDQNRDDRDDRTGSFVPVLSLTGGVVVSLESSWEPGSKLRGGKYLWIYDPASDALFYYAHNRQLTVGLGAVVSPGDPIALVGRTGLNAFKKRSPTHLHITALKLGNGTLAPENLYPLLLRCKTF
jgi:murein DD-endopeptidase MepM/ murein hydrolase activator NlpD